MKIAFPNIRLNQISLTTDNKLEGEIEIIDSRCAMCGHNQQELEEKFGRGSEKARITPHHTLAKRYKPVYNIVIPVCWSCHNDKLNANDLSAMVPLTYKIKRMVGELYQNVYSHLGPSYKNKIGGYAEGNKK